MTTETFTPAPSYTVDGTGPYAIGHAYTSGAIRATVTLAGIPTELTAGVDFTVAPASGDAGDLTLSGAAAATHDGATLTITRETTQEQGFAGQTAREKAMEAQLDRITQAMQDVGYRTSGLSDEIYDAAAAANTAAANAQAVADAVNATEVGTNSAAAQAAQVAAEAAQAAAEAAQAATEAIVPTGGTASQAEAEAGTSNDVLMTPLRTAQQRTAFLASQAEAEAGTDNTKIVTPLRAAQAISAQVVLADQAEAEAGTDNTKVMTPLRAAQAIAALSEAGLGDGQAWSSVTRSEDTTYQNTNGRTNVWTYAADVSAGAMIALVGASAGSLIEVGRIQNGCGQLTMIVPNGHYYRVTNSGATRTSYGWARLL